MKVYYILLCLFFVINQTNICPEQSIVMVSTGAWLSKEFNRIMQLSISSLSHGKAESRFEESSNERSRGKYRVKYNLKELNDYYYGAHLKLSSGENERILRQCNKKQKELYDKADNLLTALENNNPLSGRAEEIATARKYLEEANIIQQIKQQVSAEEPNPDKAIELWPRMRKLQATI